MRIWETFREGSRLYRRHFGQLFVLNAITYLPVAVVSFLVAREAMPIGADEEAVRRLVILVAGLLVVMTLWSLVSMVTLHHAVADAYQTGRCDWRDSLRRSLPRLPVFVGAMAVAGAVGAAAGLVAVLVASTGITALAVVAVLALVVLAIFGMALLNVTAPIVAREDVGVVDALRRSWELTRNRMLPIIGLILVTGLIVGLLQRMVGAAIEGGFSASVTDPQDVLLGVFASVIVPTLLFTPWTVGVMTVAYFALRRDRGEAPGGEAPAPFDASGHLVAALGDGGEPPTIRPRWSEPLGPQ